MCGFYIRGVTGLTDSMGPLPWLSALGPQVVCTWRRHQDTVHTDMQNDLGNMRILVLLAIARQHVHCEVLHHALTAREVRCVFSSVYIMRRAPFTNVASSLFSADVFMFQLSLQFKPNSVLSNKPAMIFEPFTVRCADCFLNPHNTVDV